jgi:hypothetical protein
MNTEERLVQLQVAPPCFTSEQDTKETCKGRWVSMFSTKHDNLAGNTWTVFRGFKSLPRHLSSSPRILHPHKQTINTVTPQMFRSTFIITRKFRFSLQYCLKFKYFEGWRCVIGRVVTKVSNVHSAFVCRIRQCKKTAWTITTQNLRNCSPDHMASHRRTLGSSFKFVI